MIALWIAADCDEATVRSALKLPWRVIWSSFERSRLEGLLHDNRLRAFQIIEMTSDAPTSMSSEILFVYDISVPTDGERMNVIRKRRQAQGLESKLEGWSGLLSYAGTSSPGAEWLETVEALAPTSTVVLAGNMADSELVRSSEINFVEWQGGCVSFFDHVETYLREFQKGDVLDLREAPGVPVPTAELETISESWELLTRRQTHAATTVSQEDFDSFLSGDPAWSAISSGAAYPRGTICRLLPETGGGKERMVDPVEFVLERVKSLDKLKADPFESVEQILIYAERGSGCTTLLRQIALAVAREGYPTLATVQFPKRLALDSVSNLVVRLQETWLEARVARSSHLGARPVCLILDADAELPARIGKLVRGLFGDLHRKLVIVRALRRSDDEVREAKGVLQLLARTTEEEILAIGRHMRQFCNEHGLQPIPSDDEWRVFYASFGRLRIRRPGLPQPAVESTPPLFLIGLYPFVKERVRDEHSLERYLYGRWSEIEDPGARTLVEVLAAAGVYDISIPFESLMRDHHFDGALFNRLAENDQRLLDFFVRWHEFGWQRQNWALSVRHPALGLLLMRMLHPAEAGSPYTSLSPLLNTLVGTEADHWLADQLVWTLGRYFNSTAPAFSLDVDTSIQRAARALFAAIPQDIHDSSRSICHHHARFFIHLLHACVTAIDEPESTNLSDDIVERLAAQALDEARVLLERARAIPDDRDKLSNVLNTLASSTSQLAQAYARRGKLAQARTEFMEAVDRGNEAIAHDAANGHALYSLITTILRRFENDLVNDVNEAAALFELAEERLETLARLHDSRQWRNIADRDETDVAVATLISRQLQVAKKLGVLFRGPEFSVKSSTARIMLVMREIAGHMSLSDAFADESKAERLRSLRENLRMVRDKSPRAVLLLYKLYLNDRVGRLEFETRLEILNEIERKSSDDFDPYRHDQAALLCQVGSFEAARTVFEQIYATRRADPEHWFWMNERVLLNVENGIPSPKQLVLKITDPYAGWAVLPGPRTRVKIQLRQFGDIASGQYVKACIRFNLSGLQAVDARMAAHDLAAMGFDSSMPVR